MRQLKVQVTPNGVSFVEVFGAKFELVYEPIVTETLKEPKKVETIKTLDGEVEIKKPKKKYHSKSEKKRIETVESSIPTLDGE